MLDVFGVRGILGGLLLLFGLLSRCLSGSSHVDQREAGHQQRQDRHGSTEATQYSGLMFVMMFLMISMVPIHPQSNHGLPCVFRE
jgi:hypothetical protein